MSLSAAEASAARAKLEQAGGARAKRLGRLSAPERVTLLVDEDSFFETFADARTRAPWSGPEEERPPGDSLITGVGRVCGRPVSVLAHDARFRRGAIGEQGAKKACLLIERAIAAGMPVIMLADSDGARVQEASSGVIANAQLLDAFARASGRIPLLSATLGLAGGAAGYAVALCDLNVAVADRSFAFITGPQVLEAVNGEETTLEDIGGTSLHAAKTGLLHALAETDEQATAWVKSALSYLPASAWSLPPTAAALGADDEEGAGLLGLVPEDPRRAYDIRPIITRIVDKGSFFELSAAFARNAVTGFARLEGGALGIVASQPFHLGGAIDNLASVKIARFVRLCVAYGLPLLTLCDSPGFLPGVKQEQGGLLLHGAKVISAYSEARGVIPSVALIVRKSCGAASVLSCSSDVILALPSAQVVAMGVDALLRVTFGAALSDLDPAAREQARAELAKVNEAPLLPVRSGYAHRLVEPQAARREISRAFSTCAAVRPAAPGTRKLTTLPL